MTNENTNGHDPEMQTWQPIELVNEEEAFAAYLDRHHPREAAVLRQNGMNRRTFLKLMGASMAMTGAGLSGCVTVDPPNEEIIPYVRLPEEMVPGKPLFFASSMVLNGYATGLLIETHEGRPTRVEGNPNHPASLGASNVLVQGSILELYNPERSTVLLGDGERRTWADFQNTISNMMGNRDGSGIRILTETVTSPSLADQITQLLAMYPGAKWYQYEPVSPDNVVAGSQLAFDEVVDSVYHLDQADVILSLDADFLSEMPGSLRYARDFADGRRVSDEGRNTMNRLYVAESSLTLTGTAADHRLALKASEVELFARALADALGVDVGTVPANRPWNPVWFDAVVDELNTAGSAGVVIPGMLQTPVVQAIAHAINAQLGAVGNTVSYVPSSLANPVNQNVELTELVSEMQGGTVDMLFVIGGNPVYNAPADVDFAAALEGVPFSAHLSLYYDETSALCDWHLPQTHYVETWGDARAFDGSVSIIQPPIGPLYDTVKSEYDLLAAVMQDDRSNYEILRGYWEGQVSADFENVWRKALHDGVMPDSTPDAASPALREDFASMLADSRTPEISNLEIVFRPHPNIWDGRFAFNSWLQELPHPITKVSWDNTAILSPATAEELGVSTEELIELQYGGNTLVVPAVVVPGQPNGVVTLYLGYGRGIGADVDAGRSFNAYALRTASNAWFGAGLQVDATGDTYGLAIVRSQIDVVEEAELVFAGTLRQFNSNPGDIVHEEAKDVTLLPEFEYDAYAWGMTIDLTTCIGCNACIIGCQSENNIPTVGKEAVQRAREMHWIRVDRYFVGEEDDFETYFQPVPCMHCEKAPCEQVCPVAATVHDTEGINNMVYNRCVGTRYCSANCPYSVRRFNYFNYVDDTPILQEMRNPNVTVRMEGVMEKCTYCLQRINAARIDADVEGRLIYDGEIQPACASACPTNAISFGNINDPEAQVTRLKGHPLNYDMLGELGVRPRTSYLARVTNPNESLRSASEEV